MSIRFKDLVLSVEDISEQKVEYKHNGSRLLRRVDGGAWKPHQRNMEFTKNGDQTLHRVDKGQWKELPKNHTYLHEGSEEHLDEIRKRDPEEVKQMFHRYAKEQDEHHEFHAKKAKEYSLDSDKTHANHHSYLASLHKTAAASYRKASETSGDERYKHENKAGDSIDKADEYGAKHNVRRIWNDKTFGEELDLSDFSIEELEEFLVSEEYEQLDEISKKTLGSYIKKASDQKTHLSTIAGRASLAADHSKNQDEKEYNWRLSGKWNSKAIARDRGIKKAVDKLTKEDLEIVLEAFDMEDLVEFTKSEEFIQLDELSKKTIGSYINKASRNAVDTGQFGVNIVAKTEIPTTKSIDDSNKYFGRSDKRIKGIQTAVKKLTEEETELQEISQETKNEYVHKSFTQGNELHKKLKSETDPEERAKISAQISKRNQGIIRAAKKLKEQTSNDFSIEDFSIEDFSIEELEEFLVSEEYEQLDEISKKTLGSYIEKSSDSLAKSRFVNGMNVNAKVNSADKNERDELDRHIADNGSYQDKRRKGIQLAVKKLTKEDAEIEEQSKLEESISTHNLDKAFRDPYRLSVDGMQGHELSEAIRNSSHEDKWHAKIHNVYGSSLGFDTAARRNSAKRVLASHFKKSKEE